MQSLTDKRTSGAGGRPRRQILRGNIFCFAQGAETLGITNQKRDLNDTLISYYKNNLFYKKMFNMENGK